MPKYVIIGGSVGGIGATEAIREIDPIGTVAVISEEPFPQYSRPMIADFLCGEATLERMKYRDDFFWDKNNVQKSTGKKAVSINLNDKYVELEDGDKVNFEKLLIATGGKPFLPKIDGLDKDGVSTFVTFSDAERLVAKITSHKTAVVVGGGLIGVSAAEALMKRGVKVTIVEFKDRILNLILDATAAGIVEEAIKRAGVDIITGQTVKRILGRSDSDGIVGGVVLTNDETIPCDLVIIAIGVIPRTELIMGTDIKVNRGVVVDRFMRTNVPEVYACGDVAEIYDFTIGENRQLPLFPLAHECGKIAGYNMAGKKLEHSGGTAMSALSYFNTHIISVGIMNPKDNEGY
ncbi:MAG: FAD-dependent oxidoreductase, partial [Candidatus Bathyarchaeia archaeon]